MEAFIYLNQLSIISLDDIVHKNSTCFDKTCVSSLTLSKFINQK